MDVKCERNARFGFCFRVSSRFHNEVESIPDVSVLQVLKNGIYFTLDGSTFPLGRFIMYSDFRGLSSDFEECRAEYAKAQERLVASIIDVARTYVPRFHVFASLAAQLDVLLSFAEASSIASIPYTRPQFLPSTSVSTVSPVSPVSTNGTGDCRVWHCGTNRYPDRGGTTCNPGSADGSAVHSERLGFDSSEQYSAERVHHNGTEYGRKEYLYAAIRAHRDDGADWLLRSRENRGVPGVFCAVHARGRVGQPVPRGIDVYERDD